MAKKKRFDFTKKNKRTGEEEKTGGYLDFAEEGQGRCSLYFYGDIVSAKWLSEWYEEDKCPQDIADFLGELEGYEDIDIYFNSGGGDVFAGLAIYNQLKRFGGHKVGHVDALAASIASVIMFACDELHFATGAQAMIHKPSCMAWGNADELEKIIEQLDKCEDSILDVYEQRLKDGVTREQIKALMDKETWFSGAELAEYFDIELEERATIAACASDYFDKYENVPEWLKKPGAEKQKDGTKSVPKGRKTGGAESGGQKTDSAVPEGDGKFAPAQLAMVPDIVNAVIEEIEKRQQASIDGEKEDILADLYLYGM